MLHAKAPTSEVSVCATITSTYLQTMLHEKAHISEVSFGIDTFLILGMEGVVYAHLIGW